LEHYFIASLMAYAIGILWERKMSFALCWRLYQMSNSFSTLWTRDRYTCCWTRQ